MLHSSSAHNVLRFYIFRKLSAFLFSIDKRVGIHHCRREKGLKNILKVYQKGLCLIRHQLVFPLDDHSAPLDKAVTYNVKGNAEGHCRLARAMVSRLL